MKYVWLSLYISQMEWHLFFNIFIFFLLFPKPHTYTHYTPIDSWKRYIWTILLSFCPCFYLFYMAILSIYSTLDKISIFYNCKVSEKFLLYPCLLVVQGPVKFMKMYPTHRRSFIILIISKNYLNSSVCLSICLSLFFCAWLTYRS